MSFTTDERGWTRITEMMPAKHAKITKGKETGILSNAKSQSREDAIGKNLQQKQTKMIFTAKHAKYAKGGKTESFLLLVSFRMFCVFRGTIPLIFPTFKISRG